MDAKKRAAIAAVGLVALIGLVMFARYGTVSPCGALKQTFRAQLAQQLLSNTSTNMFEAAGSAIGLAISGPIIDSMVGGLSPMQCVRGLIKLEQGDSPFDLSTSTAGSALTSRGNSVSATPASRYRDSWSLITDVSPIDDSPSIYLSVDANEEISGTFGTTHRPTLTLRCKENQTNAYIHLGTMPDIDYGSYGSKTSMLRLRFDDAAAYSEKMIVSTNNEAVFFRNDIASIKKMIGHSKLLIEFLPSNGSPQTTTFNISGLSAQITPLREACHW